MVRLHALILCLLISWQMAAAEGRFVHFGSADGLPSGSVYAITQDADGLLWVGTRNGLCRFDGTRFEVWKEFGRVNALAIDRENRLWIGTQDGLTVRCPADAGHDEFAEGPRGNIRALLTDSDGYVWATVGDTLLLKLSLADGIREEARCWYDKRDHEGDYPYFQIYEASDSKLWLAGRIVRMQYVTDRQAPAVIHPFGDGGFCTGSYAECGGKLYAFDDYTSILYIMDGREVIPMGRLPIAHARLLTDHQGRLWAAGSYGLGLVNTQKPENTKVYKTSSNELYCIFEDSQGNIWVGGDNGLSVLTSALQKVKVVSTAHVSALMEDHNGKLWIGTAEDRVSALYEDSAGTVYVGLWNNTGWEVWTGGKMAYKDHLTGDLPQEQREARHLDGANWISDFLEDSDGRFWIVTWEGVGLNQWDRKARRSFPPRWLSPFRYPSSQADSNIYLSSRLGSRIIEDAHGNLVYATTQAGLNVIDRKTNLVTKYYKGNSTIPDDYVTDLCLTPGGVVWAATRSGLWSPSGSHFLDGMLVQSVEADDTGRLWAGTEDGLYFVDTDGSTGRVPKELGFPSDIYGERVSCRMKGGFLAFGGSDGAVSFHPDSLLSIKACGNLALERLVRHRYRLNGGEWTDGAFQGFTENISPGRYVLEEQSSDIFGRWNRGEILEQTLRVPWPLWLRWPFLILYALLLVGIVWTVIRLRERRLLVKELEMKNRLFSIISHDLRNPISANRLLTRQLLERVEGMSSEQLKEGLGQLAHSADNTSNLLENLHLWTLNQKGMLEPVMRDENLTALVAEAIDTIQGGGLITVTIPSGLTVRSDRNMLLTVLRNLLDNAVKATPEGGRVEIRARGSSITITDEGPGLQEGSAHWGHGLGLRITRELLDKLGATIRMKNRPEGGLEITIDL